MTATFAAALPGRRREWLWAVVLAVVAALFLLALSGLKLPYQAAIFVGIGGLVLLAALPNRRIVLVCAWAFLHPLSLEKVAQIFPQSHPKFMPPSIVLCGSDLALVLLATVLLAEAAFLRRRIFFWPAAATPFAILCAWVVLDFFFLRPSAQGVLQVMHWLKLLVSMVVLSSAIRTRKELLLVLAVVALAVALQSAFVGITYVTHRRIGIAATVAKAELQGFSDGGAAHFVRASGTLGHVNQQAMYHVFMTLPLIALCWVRHPWWRAFFIVVVLASLLATALTFSRTSYLAWMLGIAILVFMAQRRGLLSRQGWNGLFAGLFAGLLLIIPLTKPIINRITKGDDGASASRIAMARMATDYILRFPITGVGPGNFIEQKISDFRMDRLPNLWLPRNRDQVTASVGEMEMSEIFVEGRRYYAPSVVHNKYLQVGSELGLVGLGLFLWYQWRVLGHCLRAAQARVPVAMWTGMGLVAAFWASLLFFNLDLFYDDKTVLVPVFMNLLAMAADRITAQEKLAGA